MLFGRPLQRLAVGGNFAGGLAHSDRPGVRRTHHDAFQDSLATDQRLFTALECRQELQGHQKPPHLAQGIHDC